MKEPLFLFPWVAEVRQVQALSKKMQENEYIFRKKLYLCNRFLLNRETIEDGADGHAGANPVTDEGESLFNNIKNERDIWISNKRF